MSEGTFTNVVRVVRETDCLYHIPIPLNAEANCGDLSQKARKKNEVAKIHLTLQSFLIRSLYPSSLSCHRPSLVPKPAILLRFKRCGLLIVDEKPRPIPINVTSDYLEGLSSLCIQCSGHFFYLSASFMKLK